MKRRREQLGLKVRELAAKLAVNDGDVRRYEKGTVSPRDDKIVAIAVALQTDPNYLLGFTDEPDAAGVPAPGPDDMKAGPSESQANPRRRRRGNGPLG